MAKPAVDSTDLNAERLALAYEACGQIDSLIGVLKRELRPTSDYCFDVMLATLINRIDGLNGVVFAVLARDDGHAVGNLRETVALGQMPEGGGHG